MNWLRCCCFNRTPPLIYREIRIGSYITKEYQQIKRNFSSNTVITSKYNLFTFLPRSLFEQFRRLANVYFLLISVLMLIGTYGSYYDSPLDPWSTLSVLIIVLTISICKECAEDIKRHIADRQTNLREAERIINYSNQNNQHNQNNYHQDIKVKKETEIVHWEDIKVGDLILLHNNQEIPADMIILTSSDVSGHVYIETSNIDGETNLKIRNSIKTHQSGSVWKNPNDLNNLNFIIQCEHPNSDIHNFHGTIFWNEKEIPVDATNFILRGSTIRSTNWVVGVVVYTGRESKIILNSRAAPSKLSTIEKTMNNLIYVIFSAQILLSTVSLVCYLVWNSYHSIELNYLCYNSATNPNPLFRENCTNSSDYSAAGYFFTFFILYNNFLPISLYVTVEFCNYVQAYFIDNDIKLYDIESNTPAFARTSNMNGDLGMIEYVFSDKTGTLTQNIMCFRQCSVGGIIYSVTDHQIQKNNNNDSINNDNNNNNFNSINMIQNYLHDTNSIQSHFVFVLSIAHTVVIDHETNGYQSESPDEEALVKAGEMMGWKFISRKPEGVTIQYKLNQNQNNNININKNNNNINNETQINKTFEILALIPFDSTRKRMSVVVKHPDTNQIILYCKGADNVIFERATSFANGSSQTLLESHLSEFATSGLRTLAISMRVLSEHTFNEFMKLWKEAEVVVIGRKELIQKAAAIIERDLIVLGITAIEDKLQDQVPDTIADLGIAGVKLWVLTGDKVQTAINIGYASHLLGPNMMLIHLHDIADDLITIKHRIANILLKLKRITEDDELVRNIRKVIHERINQSITPAPPDSSPLSLHSANTLKNLLTNQDDILPSHDLNNIHTNTININNNNNHNHNLNNNNSNNNNNNNNNNTINLPSLENLTSDHLALIIDGDILTKLLGDSQAEKLLLMLGKICKSVLACRVSPEQKRLLVRLVRRGITPQPVTLAIGDGANDVAMIQEAQIGVGISGKEGRQAVNASDFAIAQFRFLKRLMLVHGRSDYRRVSRVILFSLYKNIVLTITLFFYTFFNGFSGQTCFDDYVYSGYNLFLSMPVIAIGLFDWDVSPQLLEHHNILYVTGRERQDMNLIVFCRHLFHSLVDACIIFFLVYGNFKDKDITSQSGKDDDLWIFGTIVYNCLFFSQCLRCAWYTYTWTWLSIFLWLISFGFYFAFLLIYQEFPFFYNYYKVSEHTLNLPVFWFLSILIPFVSISIDIVSTYIQREFYPTLLDVCIEYDRGFKTVDNISKSTTKSNMLASPPGLNVKEAEINLSKSRVVGKNNQFPLDWGTIRSLFSGYGPGEKEIYGIQDTSENQPKSSYIYDYVSRDFGPGAGFNLFSSAFSKVGTVFFGDEKNQEVKVSESGME